MMLDSFGRTIDYLRVALTDRCNLKCWYCRGRGDVSCLSDSERLRHDEFVRLLGLAVQELGIVKIRLTGGEPLLYPKLAELITFLNSLSGLQEITLTTNGLLLAESAPFLRRAGLDRINVSLEGASNDAYRRITGQACLDQVLAGLEALLEAGFAKPKINIVLCRPFSRDELKQLLEITQRYADELRFIELMGYSDGEFPTVDEIAKQFAEIAELQPITGQGTATRRYAIEGCDFILGLIPSRTEPFCADCRRIRLASDGQLRTCLFTREGIELRPYLRRGCSDQELVNVMRNAIMNKPQQAVGTEVKMCCVGG